MIIDTLEGFSRFELYSLQKFLTEILTYIITRN